MKTVERLLEFKFPAEAAHLSDMRSKLRDALREARYSNDVVDCLILAVGEACMNIIQHAYCDDDCGDIVIEVERQASNLVFRITDFAQYKSKTEEMKSRRLDEIRPGGLGCHIINEIMDEVILLDCKESQGNVLQMRKTMMDPSSF